jgi:hypothetical protein
MQQLLSEKLTAHSTYQISQFYWSEHCSAKLHWIIRINKTAVHSPCICKYLLCSNVLRLFYPVILRGNFWTKHHHPLSLSLNRAHFPASVHSNAFRSDAFSQFSCAVPPRYLCMQTVMWLNHDKHQADTTDCRRSSVIVCGCETLGCSLSSVVFFNYLGILLVSSLFWQAHVAKMRVKGILTEF